MKAVLRTFFAPNGFNLTTGFTVMHEGVATLVRGTFGGFLADEKALKEIFSYKGAGGSKPCCKCGNVFQHIDPHILERMSRDLGRPLVGIDCCRYASFSYNTDDVLCAMVDRVSEASRGPAKALKELEQDLGVK